VIPLAYFEPYKPINLEIILPLVDKDLDNDLDVDHGLNVADPYD
jgi:hypothetical protein